MLAKLNETIDRGFAVDLKNCRGDDRKLAILSQYELKPVTHSVLIPGHHWDGCCGLLEAEYYAFEYTSKDPGGRSGVLYVGDHCARKFLELLSLDPLPLFNPLRSANNNVSGPTASTGGTSASRQTRCKINQELWDAINLTMSIRQMVATGGLYDQLEYIRNYPDRPAYPNRIERVNNYRKRIYQSHHVTLREEIDDLIAKGIRVRAFDFSEIRKALTASGSQNFIDP